MIEIIETNNITSNIHNINDRIMLIAVIVMGENLPNFYFIHANLRLTHLFNIILCIIHSFYEFQKF